MNQLGNITQVGGTVTAPKYDLTDQGTGVQSAVIENGTTNAAGYARGGIGTTSPAATWDVRGHRGNSTVLQARSAVKSYTITNRSRTSNIATVTVGNHGFVATEQVQVTGVSDATFNTVSSSIISVTATTISYSNSGSNVAGTASGGTAAVVASGDLQRWVNQANTVVASVSVAGAVAAASVAATGTVTGSNLSGTNTGDQTITLTSDVTGTGTGSFAATIANNAVTDAKLRDSAALSVIGRSANSTGDPADIAAGSDGQFLVRRSSALAFGALVAGDIPAVNTLTSADPAFADLAVGWDTSASANRQFQADRLLGLARMAPGGRLTLTSGTPVTTSDVTGATSIYYTPYLHDMACLWDGTRWVWTTFAETTLALGTLTGGRPYDVFGYLSSGTFTLESLVWANDTTRATAVTIQDGRYCKSGDKTRLYLGTFRTTSTTTTEDSLTKRFVWNTYQRRRRRLAKSISAVDYPYTTATWRNVNSDATFRVEWCVGLSEDPLALVLRHRGYGGGIGVAGIGIDTSGSTTPATGLYEYLYGNGGNYDLTTSIVYDGWPGLGYHFAQAQEQGGTSTSFSPSVCSGLTGYVEA